MCGFSYVVGYSLFIRFLIFCDIDKEAWEPTIEYLFNTVKDATSTGGPLIREAWSFDMPNHGESAALNEDVLNEGKAGLSESSVRPGLLDVSLT